MQTPDGDPVAARRTCRACGAIYDPAKGDPEHEVPPGTAFEDLPDEWVCPVCGSEKDQYVSFEESD